MKNQLVLCKNFPTHLLKNYLAPWTETIDEYDQNSDININKILKWQQISLSNMCIKVRSTYYIPAGELQSQAARPTAGNSSNRVM